MREGDPITEFIEMDQPISCYYNRECKTEYNGSKYKWIEPKKHFFDTNTNTCIPETSIQPSTNSPTVQPPVDVEYKVITLK